MNFTWDDIANADDYVLRQDTVPSGTFGTVSGTAPNGGGLLVAIPPDPLVLYLAAGRSSPCGEGPLR